MSTTGAPSPKTLVYAGDHWLIVMGRVPNVGDHQHPAPAFCFGLDRPFEVRDPASGKLSRYESLLVPTETRGPLIAAEGQAMAFVFLSAEHPAYYALRRWACTAPIPGGVPAAEEMLALLRRVYREAPPFETVQQGMEAILAKVHGRQPDPRIRQALAALRRDDSGSLSLEAVARQVCLSPSRLVHLFKEETGATFRRQRLWMRIMHSTTLATRTRSLTDIASAVGFSDLAHYSRTFRRVFGMKPTSIIRFDGSMLVYTERYRHCLGTPPLQSAAAQPVPWTLGSGSRQQGLAETGNRSVPGTRGGPPPH